MQDSFGRTIDYLRVSVTDKCNLRCRYCMPPEGVRLIAHGDLLSIEELSRVIGILAGLGIRSVRFTGGEPLVRKNLAGLIRDTGQQAGIHEMALTTNGVLLAEQLPELCAAGLTAVNISLDTIDPAIYRAITGTDACGRVLDAIRGSVQAGLRTKVNCVPCREWNADALTDVAALARELPVDVRFIELMPIGCGRQFHGIPSDVVLCGLEQAFGAAQPADERRGSGPARYYAFDGFQGKVGFISPLSHQFCSECNRIRLTAEGYLKLCLHYDTGLGLRALLRGGATDADLRDAILEAVFRKPKEHDFAHTSDDADSRRMVQIGG